MVQLQIKLSPHCPIEVTYSDEEIAWQKTCKRYREMWRECIRDGASLHFRAKVYKDPEVLLDLIGQRGKWDDLIRVSINFSLRGGMQDSDVGLETIFDKEIGEFLRNEGLLNPTPEDVKRAEEKVRNDQVIVPKRVITIDKTNTNRSSDTKKKCAEQKNKQKSNTHQKQQIRSMIDNALRQREIVADDDIVHYESSAPRVKKDQAWIENQHYGKLEDQASYMKYLYHANNVHYGGIMLDRKPVGGKRNVLSDIDPTVNCTYLFPKYTFWSEKFEYGWDLLQGIHMRLRWKSPRGMHYIVFRHKMKLLHTNDLFMEMAVAAPEDNVSIYQPQLIAVPPYSFYQEELWWAQTKGYSVNSINSLRYENFLKSYAAACESGMILDCRVGRATELWRLVTSQITNIKYNMFQTMTLDLERQREVNKMTSSVPEVSSWKVFIKRLLFYLLPRSAAEFITRALS